MASLTKLKKVANHDLRYTEITSEEIIDFGINCIWSVHSCNQGSRWSHAKTIYPDGYADIIFNASAHSKLQNSHLSNTYHSKTTVLGMQSGVAVLEPFSRVACIGIRICPTVVPSLLGVSSRNLLDKYFCATDLPRDARLFLKRLEDSIDPEVELTKETSEEINGMIRDRLRSRVVTDKALMLANVSRLLRNSSGSIGVKELARRLEVTPQYLNREIQGSLGMSAKFFARMLRVSSVIRTLENKPSSHGLSDLALSHGFYDQAHLCNEFKKFTNISPARFSRNLI